MDDQSDAQQLAFATPGIGAYVLRQVARQDEPSLRPDPSGLTGE